LIFFYLLNIKYRKERRTMYDWLMDMIISFLEMLIPGDSSNNYEE